MGFSHDSMLRQLFRVIGARDATQHNAAISEKDLRPRTRPLSFAWTRFSRRSRPFFASCSSALASVSWFMGSPCWCCSTRTLALVLTRKRKKPTWQNTLRYSTTPAYLLTSLPAMLGCSSSSHPTTISIVQKYRSCFHRFSASIILLLETDKANGFSACRGSRF